jgi:hypothetical protein
MPTKYFTPLFSERFQLVTRTRPVNAIIWKVLVNCSLVQMHCIQAEVRSQEVLNIARPKPINCRYIFFERVHVTRLTSCIKMQRMILQGFKIAGTTVKTVCDWCGAASTIPSSNGELIDPCGRFPWESRILCHGHSVIVEEYGEQNEQTSGSGTD